MIAVDTNILVYSHRLESRFHTHARDLIRGYAQGSQRWAIPWPCIYEFFSVTTNSRIWKANASTPKQASAQIAQWLGSPVLSLLGETVDFADIVLRFMQQPRVRGPIIHDARVASLCLAHGVDELLSKDRDFQLFPELKTRDPFAD